MPKKRTYELAFAILSALGAGISWKLLQIHTNLASGQSNLQGNCSIAGFGTGSSCEEVALSAYSQIGPVPLAALALGFYVALGVLLFWKLVVDPQKREVSQVLLNLATVGLVVTVIMASISSFALAKFCVWCAGLWAVNILIWPLALKLAETNAGSALKANLQTFSGGKAEMDKNSLYSWLSIAGGVVALVTLLGTTIESNAIEKANQGGIDRSIRKFNGAPQIFVDPAVYADGPSVKGTSLDKAVLSIVKFSDFQCPACKGAAQAFKPFFLKHKDKVRFVYRNYPLDGSCNPHVPNGGHTMACTAAKAAICAGVQGKFYDMHDALFDGQTDLSKAFVAEAAKKIGLKVPDFESCLEDNSTVETLKADMNWGESIHLDATPTFVVNGRKIPGGFTMLQWEALLAGVEKARNNK